MIFRLCSVARELIGGVAVGGKHLLHLAVGNRLANIRAKLPDEAAAEVMAHVYAVRDAPTLDARAAADRVIAANRGAFAAAVACFADDLDALLAIHRVPVRHRIRVRTTNLAERSFVGERRRTKVSRPVRRRTRGDELVFATMISDVGSGGAVVYVARRAADRWCRVLDHRPGTPPTQTAAREARPRPAASRHPQDGPTQTSRCMINRPPHLQDARDSTSKPYCRLTRRCGSRTNPHPPWSAELSDIPWR